MAQEAPRQGVPSLGVIDLGPAIVPLRSSGLVQVGISGNCRPSDKRNLHSPGFALLNSKEQKQVSK